MIFRKYFRTRIFW